jgi:hypothetical protein
VKNIVVAMCALAVFGLLATPAVAQGPKPGPEHRILKQLEGTWEATVSGMGEDSKGTMTWKMGIGGLWLIGDFQGELGGGKFLGKGLDSYDPAKKKYVSVWCDSMSATPLLMEGSYDKKKKTMTMVGEGPGPDGKKAKYKAVTTRKGNDALQFTMSMVGEDGKDQPLITISYKRKK